MDSYVLGFAFTLAGQVALIEKTHPDWQAGRLNGIGGELDGGEGHNIAMVRKFHEETGVVTDPADWGYRGIMRGEDWAVHVFTMTDAKIENAATLTKEEVFLLDLDDERINDENTAIENVRALIELCRIPVSQPSGVFPRFELQYC